jgi:hypothetical protein
MSSLNKNDYLELLKKLLDQQYNDAEEDVEENAWIPAESPLKDKIPIFVQSGIIDLTNAKKDKIKHQLFQSTNFRVDHFLIKLKKSTVSKIGSNLELEIQVFEEKFKTPSGAPCRMTYRLDIFKDNRFKDFIHLSKFKNSYASKVGSEVFVDLIRWMQAIRRMTAFL